MLKGFMDFITRGNVVDLAVAVVIGAAFTGVVNALVAGIINPLIAAIFGQPDLSSVGVFTINDAVFSLGAVLNALVTFLLIAAAIYFLVIVPINALNERRRRAGVDPETEVAPSDEALLLAEIRDLFAGPVRDGVGRRSPPGLSSAGVRRQAPRQAT
jgi:large conductance mechanosensitive channel